MPWLSLVRARRQTRPDKRGPTTRLALCTTCCTLIQGKKEYLETTSKWSKVFMELVHMMHHRHVHRKHDKDAAHKVAKELDSQNRMDAQRDSLKLLSTGSAEAPMQGLRGLFPDRR